MVNLKSVQCLNERVIQVEILLPFVVLVMMVDTKGFLCGSWFQMDQYQTINSAICVMKDNQDLLKSEVVQVNQKARDYGIVSGMSGEMAILLMHEKQIKD